MLGFNVISWVRKNEESAHIRLLLPLYSEDNKNLTRVFVANASKIFSEFKILFNRWSISASDAVRNRCEVVIAYLRHLEPKFTKIKDFDFKELLDSLLPGTTAQNGFIFRSLPEPEGTLVNVAGKNEEEAADSTSQDSQERSVLMELKINTSIFEDTVDLCINKDRKTKSRIICNKLPSPPSQVTQVSQNQTPKTVVITKNRNSSGKQRIRPAPAILTRVLVPPPEIIDLDCEIEMPNTKMPRLELGTSRNKDKPVINAFTVLMNRSKEIALAEKLRRAGVPPN